MFFFINFISTLGESSFSKRMQNPVSADKVIYAGLTENPEPNLKTFGDDFSIPVITAEEIKKNNKKIIKWIRKQGITKLLVHFDLDVLSPKDFRSLTSAKPYQTVEEFGASIGELKLDEAITFLNEINKKAEIVGLSVAEYIPWDVINLRKALSELKIFNS